MRRATAAAVVGVFLLVAGACSERSNVAPEANVTLSGKVTDVGGAPLVGRPVKLGSGVSELEGGAGFLTAGLFCLSGACSGERFDTTTGDDGSYAFELAGRDTQSTFGEAVSFLLTTSAEPQGDHPTGPALAARFQIQETDLTLPSLGLVDPALQLSAAAGGRAIASWDGRVAPGPYTVAFAAEDGLPVWEAEAADASAEIDGRVLEDSVGVAVVSGSRRDAIEGSDLTITWRSSGVAFRGGFGAPPSRGSGCEVVGADGAAQLVDDCPLTDGSFRPAGLPTTVCPAGQSTTTCSPVTRVRVELPSPAAADLLVVRGCANPCRAAAVASDGAATDLGPVSGPFATAKLPGSPIAAVELTTADPADLAEVAIWSSATTADQGLAPLEEPIDLDQPRGGRDDEDDRRPVAAAVAVVLLLGAVVLLARVRHATLPR